MHAHRVRRGLRRGLVPTVVPYTGYGGAGWARVLGRVVLLKPGETRSERLSGIRGWRSFTSIPVRDAEVQVRAGDTTSVIRSDRGGVLDARVDSTLEPGWHTVGLAIGEDAVSAPMMVVDAGTDFGIVSDVDDTVMVTLLPRPFLAAWNTFVLDEHARTPVAGMAVLYDRLTRAHPDAPFIYLSTGAWNVVPTLSRFFSRNLYPRGPLLLTDWGPTHDRWFRNGPEHKRASLRRLQSEFPGIRWLLVGDDGQADERIYGEFATAHPGNVAAVAIRRLTTGEAVLAGRRKPPAPPGPDGVPWRYGLDGAELGEELTDLGFLREGPSL